MRIAKTAIAVADGLGVMSRRRSLAAKRQKTIDRARHPFIAADVTETGIGSET
jgi:hypothetical protein